MFQLSKVRVFDISREIADRYKADMQERFGLDIEITGNPQAAVLDADLLVTAGPFLRKPTPIVPHHWIKPGALVCPLDLDSYVKPDVFAKSDFLCTDDRNQFKQFKAHGLFQSCPEGIAELCDVIAGKIPGRENDRQIVTAVNIGLALEDMAVAPLIFEGAERTGVGISLDL
jgi:ornithine cyclodeaminase/alanine dehydrogenase-like protein (mu-crystallin family)